MKFINKSFGMKRNVSVAFGGIDSMSRSELLQLLIAVVHGDGYVETDDGKEMKVAFVPVDEMTACKYKYESRAYAVTVENLESQLKELTKKYRDIRDSNEVMMESNNLLGQELHKTQAALDKQTERAEYFKKKLFESCYGKEEK